MKPTQIKYVPGVCNINYKEIAYRRNAGYFGAIVFVFLLFMIIVFTDNNLYKIVLFVPAFIVAISYLQVKNKFCVKYGASSLQNATEGNQTAVSVTDKKSIIRDKSKVKSMYLQAFIMATAVTALVTIL